MSSLGHVRKDSQVNNPENGVADENRSAHLNGILMDHEPTKDGLPDIAHVTNNIIPLSQVLRFYTQEAYKQLSTLVETVANEKDTESDVNRKRRFLDVIINLRQDFVKLYTLVKWASYSKEVSKLIDILNWLRSQEFYFDNLGFRLFELNGFSGAKLPNSDIVTSLEVFLKGRPQLPSYNLIKPPKISPKKTLEVLQDLNLVLQTRMALLKNIPDRFIKNYVVKDGRIYFTIPNEFQVAVTVANDSIIFSEEEYEKSPFYFIDFKFLFGINLDSYLITYRDSKMITGLPRSSHAYFEKMANNILLRQGLQGLYEICHRYCVSFKLYLITRQLRDLSINTKWRNNIQFKYLNTKSLIIVNYWSSHYLSRNWRSFIEIGINKKDNLSFRWFKNGHYILDHGITGLFRREPKSPTDEDADNEISQLDSQYLSIDFALSVITNKHAEYLISKIYSEIDRVLSGPDYTFATRIGPHHLLLNLAPLKEAIFAINSLTGHFYFTEPNANQNRLCRRINSQLPQYNTTKFYSEAHMIKDIVKSLITLRLESFRTLVNHKLITTGWIPSDGVRLSEQDILKNLIADQSILELGKIEFHRRKNWPFGWFLTSLVNGKNSTVYWWATRMRSIKAEWKLQWASRLPEAKAALDYNFFCHLPDVCFSILIDNVIMDELSNRNIKYVMENNINALLEKYKISFDDVLEEGESEIHQSYVVLYNDNDSLLPIKNSSTSIFMRVRILKLNGDIRMCLKLIGHLRNLKIMNFYKSLVKLGLNINRDKEIFEINDLIDLSKSVNENSSHSNVISLDSILNNLNRLKELIKVMEQLHKSNIEIIDNSIDALTIKVDDAIPRLRINLPENFKDSIELSHGPDNVDDSHELMILPFLNTYLRDQASEYSMSGLVKYLREVSPILGTLKSMRRIVQKNTSRMANGLPKLDYDLKISHLNSIRLVYYFNYSNNPPKKIIRNKVVISLSLRFNRFGVEHRPMLNLSLKENLNSQNLKHKPLFEQIFSAITTYNLELDPAVAKTLRLSYDFLIDPQILEPLMLKITDRFIQYTKSLGG